MRQPVRIPHDEALELYATMARIRFFEEKILQLCGQNRVPGITQLCIGQEAVAAGSVSPLRHDDFVLATYRGHGHAIAKGSPLHPLMAEVLGRQTGCCKGKGGPMHLTDIQVGNPGLHPIVGAQIPIGCGVALAMKRLQTDRVCLVDFGDGAVQTGIFHESLNLASLWKLPVVFTCSNNLYAVSVPHSAASPVSDVADRAAGYAVPSEIVDGQDVFAVTAAVSHAVERARHGKGPTLIECKTYRFVGHSQFDPNDGEKYRSRKEIELWRRRDPLLIFRKKSILCKVSGSELDSLEAAAKNEVDEATKRALEDPWPAPHEAFTDIYA
jgi:TPP-dependent pyruvate/acetoin dehydrogenase alpha subunit